MMARSRSPTGDFGDHGQELVYLISAQSPRRAWRDLWPLEFVAGVGLNDIHANEKAIEGTDAGNAGADG